MTLAEARSGAGGLGQRASAASADLGVRLCLALVALLLLFRVLLAATADLSEDEAYYWLWSTHLAAGYYDHPPMIAYWIRAGTAVFGQTGFGVRFAALLSSLAGSYVLYRASLSLFGDRNAALLAVLWLNATLFCNAAAIIATPDTPLAFFAILTLFALAKLTETGRGAWWYALGAALGLAFMSKYTAVLLLPGIFLWMIALPSGRRWFLRPEPYLGAVIAAAIVAPVFYWNFTHDWASFAKQAQHGMGDQPGNAFASIAGLVGAQAGLATPIIFAFCVWGSFFALLRGWKRRDSRWLLPGALTAPVFLFFLVHSASHKIQPNWPGFIYPVAVLAAVHSFLALSRERGLPAWLPRQLPFGAVARHCVYGVCVSAAGDRRFAYRGEEGSNRQAERLGQARRRHNRAGSRRRRSQRADTQLCHDGRARLLRTQGSPGDAGQRAHTLCKPAGAG